MDENYDTLQYKTCVFGIRNKDKTHRELYVIRTLEKVMDDTVPNYGAIIVEKNHPEFDVIMEKFDEIAAFFMK